MRILTQVEDGDSVSSVLAGLETGVLGALFLFAYHVLGSLAAGDGIWGFHQRLAAAVFGRSILRQGLMSAAAAGFALQVVASGALGVVFALVVRGAWAFRRVLLLGPILGLGWYYFAYEVLLRKFGLGSYLVAPRRTLVVAHLLFGLLLAMYPRLLIGVRRGLSRL